MSSGDAREYDRGIERALMVATIIVLFTAILCALVAMGVLVMGWWP